MKIKHIKKNKKALKAQYALGRSKIGLGQRLGTVTHKSSVDYDRKNEKRILLDMIKYPE